MLTDIVVVCSLQNYQLVELPTNLPHTYSYGYDFGLIYISAKFHSNILDIQFFGLCCLTTALTTATTTQTCQPLCVSRQDINSHDVSRQHTVDLLKILGTEHKSIFIRQHWSPSWVLALKSKSKSGTKPAFVEGNSLIL